MSAIIRLMVAYYNDDPSAWNLTGNGPLNRGKEFIEAFRNIEDETGYQLGDLVADILSAGLTDEQIIRMAEQFNY